MFAVDSTSTRIYKKVLALNLPSSHHLPLQDPVVDSKGEVISLDWEPILIQFLQIKSYPTRDSLYQIQLQNCLRNKKKLSTRYFSHKK